MIFRSGFYNGIFVSRTELIVEDVHGLSKDNLLGLAHHLSIIVSHAVYKPQLNRIVVNQITKSSEENEELKKLTIQLDMRGPQLQNEREKRECEKKALATKRIKGHSSSSFDFSNNIRLVPQLMKMT